MKSFLAGIYLLVLIWAGPLNGYSQTSVVLGAGAQEGFYYGARYQIKQSQIGFSISRSPNYGNRDSSPFNPSPRISIYSVSFQRHLFGMAKLSDRMPWFVKLGAVYFRDFTNTPSSNHHFLFGNLLFGNEFNFTKRLGLSVAIGVAPVILEKHYYGPNGFGSSGLSRLQPGIDLNIFYKVVKI